MKKILLLVFTLLLTVLLISCEGENSIGIIGGADGPTAVIVSK